MNNFNSYIYIRKGTRYIYNLIAYDIDTHESHKYNLTNDHISFL